MYIGGYGGQSEIGLGVFRELCPVGFLVFGESVGFVVACSHMLIVVMVGKWADDIAC